MIRMINVDELIVGYRTIKESAYQKLKDKPVQDWPPIRLAGNKVILGGQQVLVAKKLGIKEIPYTENNY